MSVILYWRSLDAREPQDVDRAFSARNAANRDDPGINHSISELRFARGAMHSQFLLSFSGHALAGYNLS